MAKQRKGHIAFIAIDTGGNSNRASHSDIGGASDTYSQTAWDLADLGWYVDLFAHQSEPPVHEDHPRYRKIFLPISLDNQIDRILESLESAVQAFLRYQETQGILYPVIHTHCWASAWVGARIKQHQFIRFVHSYCGSHGLSAQPSMSNLRPAAIERQCLESVDCLITMDPVCGNGSAPPPALPVLNTAAPAMVHRLRQPASPNYGAPSPSVAEQLDAIYREQIDLLCHQFFFTSPIPGRPQSFPPAADPSLANP